MYRFLSSQKSLPGTPRAPARMHISLHGGKGFANLTRRRRPSSASVLLVAGFGAFLAFLDSTIVNIAFPDIQRSFPSYDIGSLSWILNGYNIVFAAFMVAAGRLADLLGRRRTFLSGVLVFTIASGLCAVAGSVEQLVAFRVLQGIGAAILVPASLALVVEGFDAARRAHAIGLWGAAAAIAAGLGPPIGGLLVEWAGWRWVLLVNVPLGIVAAIATKRMLVESRASGRRRMPDLRGALLLAVTLGLVTLGLVKGPDWGWLSVATVGSFLASVLTSVGFVHSSRSHPAPLVEPALLRSRSFVAGNLLTLVAAAGFYCYGLTHVLYLNYVWHYSLLKAGFAIAPAAVVAAVVAAALGRVAGRHGHRVIVLVGALEPPIPQPAAAPIEHWAAGDADPLGNLPLFAGLDAATLAQLGEHVEDVELEAGCYLFHEGDPSDSLYVIRTGRVQVLQDSIVLKELGRGEVLGELGLLIDAPRSATVRALRDTKLVRLTKAQFDEIADHGALAALVKVLATRLREAPPPATDSTSPEVVVSVIGVSGDAPVPAVAAGLLTALSARLRAVDPGRVDRDGLDRAERVADKVVLHAAVEDAGWRDFCLRVADRIVLVAGDPNPQAARLPARARGADLVLAGPAASREHRRQWEELITPRSVHVVHYRRILENVRPLAARIAGRSIGLVLGGGGARGFAHLGVLDELERVGVTIDRFAGTSMGAVIAVFGACGMDAATADAYAYEYFIRHNPLSDYAFPVRGLVRGRRTLTLLEAAFGDRLVEELPKEFRCVSVDLLARRPVVHRRGRLVDVIGCSLRLPGIYPPQVYNGRLHVDGGVLDNLPVSTRASPDGPLIAVSIGLGGGGPGSARQDGSPKVPGIGDTLMRTMTIGSQRGADAALSLAQVVIRPDTGAVGLLEFHQIDAAREAGRVAAREAMPHIMALLNR